MGIEVFLKELQPNANEGFKIANWLSDTAVNRFLEARFEPPTESEQELLISEWYADPQILYLGIYVKNQKLELIGTMKFGPYNLIHKRGELGLVIGESKYWGLGIATKCIMQAEGVVKDNFVGIRKITAGAYSENIGSIKAFQNNGFIIEGTLNDQVISGLNRSSVVLLGKSINSD